MIALFFEQCIKTVFEHFKRNGSKYAAGGAVAAAGAGGYMVGKSIGHKNGKKEGTYEQAKRDEKKIKQMHEVHEKDRKNWKKQQKRYEELLDEIEKKL